MKSISYARKNNSKITFDLNIRKEILNDQKKREFLLSILWESDIIIAGEDELTYLVKGKDEDEIVVFGK